LATTSNAKQSSTRSGQFDKSRLIKIWFRRNEQYSIKWEIYRNRNRNRNNTCNSSEGKNPLSRVSLLARCLCLNLFGGVIMICRYPSFLATPKKSYFVVIFFCGEHALVNVLLTALILCYFFLMMIIYRYDTYWYPSCPCLAYSHSQGCHLGKGTKRLYRISFLFGTVGTGFHRKARVRARSQNA
jgi:hypothetical protein